MINEIIGDTIFCFIAFAFIMAFGEPVKEIAIKIIEVLIF